MNDEKAAIEELRGVLRSFVAKSFPKRCACGKRYEDVDNFLAQTTESEYPSNLLQIMGYRDQAVTALARDCECGAPLVVIINDRRDRTSEGIRVRRDFGRILYALEQAGMESEMARHELLDVLEGKDSPNIGDRELDMIKRLRPAWDRLHRHPSWRDRPRPEPVLAAPPPVEIPEPEDEAAPAVSEIPTAEKPPEVVEQQVDEPPKEEEPSRCKGTTKAGKPCKLLALRGSDYCQMHQPRE